jgi:cell division protein FtsB
MVAVSLEHLHAELEFLKRQVAELRSEHRYTDERVYALAESYLKERKRRGLKTVTSLDLLHDLHLPLDQVNRVIARLERERKLTAGE